MERWRIRMLITSYFVERNSCLLSFLFFMVDQRLLPFKLREIFFAYYPRAASAATYPVFACSLSTGSGHRVLASCGMVVRQTFPLGSRDLGVIAPQHAGLAINGVTGISKCDQDITQMQFIERKMVLDGFA